MSENKKKQPNRWDTEPTKFQEVDYPDGEKAYRSDFDFVALDVLSRKQFQSKTHLACALGICKNTVLDWERDNPSFAAAIQKGLAISEKLTREKMEDHAYLPQRDVNNGLIKLLANNVYGIKDESPTVVVNNNSVADPSEELSRRGIPEPEGFGEDVEDFEDE